MRAAFGLAAVAAALLLSGCECYDRPPEAGWTQDGLYDVLAAPAGTPPPPSGPVRFTAVSTMPAEGVARATHPDLDAALGPGYAVRQVAWEPHGAPGYFWSGSQVARMGGTGDEASARAFLSRVFDAPPADLDAWAARLARDGWIATCAPGPGCEAGDVADPPAPCPVDTPCTPSPSRHLVVAARDRVQALLSELGAWRVDPAPPPRAADVGVLVPEAAVARSGAWRADLALPSAGAEGLAGDYAFTLRAWPDGTAHLRVDRAPRGASSGPAPGEEQLRPAAEAILAALGAPPGLDGWVAVGGDYRCP